LPLRVLPSRLLLLRLPRLWLRQLLLLLLRLRQLLLNLHPSWHKPRLLPNQRPRLSRLRRSPSSQRQCQHQQSKPRPRR